MNAYVKAGLLMLAAWLPCATAAGQAARERYDTGEFAGAEAAYRAALAAPSAAVGPLWFGIGNCAYRQGRLAEALLAYRKAALRLPRDPTLQFNIAWTEQRLGAERPAPSLLTSALAPLDRFTLRELLWATAVLQGAGLCGALLLRRFRRLRRTALVGAGAGALLGMHLIFAAWLRPAEAIVLAPLVTLRVEPHADATPAARGHAGDTVVVDEAGDIWLHVRHPAGTGWVERAHVGVVD